MPLESTKQLKFNFLYFNDYLKPPLHKYCASQSTLTVFVEVPSSTPHNMLCGVDDGVPQLPQT